MSDRPLLDEPSDPDPERERDPDPDPADHPEPAAESAPRPRGSALATTVGVVGEVLITLGVLLGLFVVWQLWWTDVVADREQADIVRGLGWVAPTTPPTVVQTAEPDPRRYDDAPVAAEPAAGTTFAVLRVPRWGADYLRPISQGTSKEEVLDVLGIGHYEGTEMPGAIGNFAVAGHRVTYGKPFNRIEELAVDDPLVVQTADTWYVYRVTYAEVVSPAQTEVLAPVPGQPGAEPTVAVMTLTTCHPMYSARERYVVHADLDYWMPVDAGIPEEITPTRGGD